MNSESLPKPDNDKFQRLKPQRANAVLQSLAKIPPNALEMEQAVLGAILLEKNAITAVMDVLKPESFYSDQHRIIYETVLDLFQTSQPIDLLTVSNHLRTKGKLEQAGSAYYLAELTSRVASAANIEFHARVIAEKYLQRELIFISDRIIRDAFEDTTDVLELLDRAESDLFSLSENNLRRNYSTMKDLIVKTIRQLEVIKSKGNSITGVPSGFSQLDQMTAGFQSSDLIIIAARPAMGKTAFVLTLARNAAVRFKIPVAFFSLEMSATQLVQRLISAEAEVPQEQIRIGNLSDEEWRRITNRNNELSKANLIIDDSPSMTIMELRAKCRRLKSEKDIGMVVIDYLQLMRGSMNNKNGTREQEISNISRSLKELAKELNIPVIALSQLNRSVETRKEGDKEPQLSDLRESGSIEQDADVVMMIHRPEYYKQLTDEEGNSTQGLAKILIRKQRNGPTGEAKLYFNGQFARFQEWENSSYFTQTDSLAKPFEPSEKYKNQGPPAPSTKTIQSKMNSEEDIEGSFEVPF